MRLSGVKVTTPFRQYSPHKHDWQKAIKHKYGAVFYLHVCMNHPEPLLKAYHMSIEDPSQFQGQLEYDERSKKQ